jgi:hypothetical protein
MNCNVMLYQQWYSGASQSAVTGANQQFASGTVLTAAATCGWYYYEQTAITSNWQTATITYGAGDCYVVTNWPEPETEEQRTERERAWAESEAKRMAVAARAEELLLSVLTDKQKESYKKEKLFDVEIADKVYRLRDRQRAQLLKNGKPIVEYCIHPSYEHGLPAEDVLIAQKLLLETDETAFLRIANHTRIA